MRESEFEHKEEIPSVNLGIREPDGDKNFMITFNAPTEKAARAYNYAVQEVMSEAKLNPFHQIGASHKGSNDPGLHGWEAWYTGLTREKVEALLPRIEKLAKEYYY